MGDKKPSIRTLPDGYQVTHHPDGRQVLLPGQSKLRAQLLADEEANKAKLAELQGDHERKVAARKARYSAHPAVPGEKRFH